MLPAPKARLWMLVPLPLALAAQPAPLTLPEAEAIAVRNHPRVAGSVLGVRAAEETVKQARTALLPFIAGNVTGSVAENGSRLGAGAINTPALFSRTATGINITQTVFDFGRSHALTEAARTRVSALKENSSAVRAEVLLRVREAYYRALLANSQHRVMTDAVQTRKVTLKQVSAFVQSNKRSPLDESFAELAVAEAELMADRAGNEQEAAMVALSAALGYADNRQFELAEPAEPEALPADADGLVALALKQRPELVSQRLEAQASRQAAETERRQRYPTLNAVGAAGLFGWRDDRLRPHYGAFAMNLNIPVFNGNLFASRFREANLRAEVQEQAVRETEIRVARDVRSAWIDARNAFHRRVLAQRVSEQAARTQTMARERYDQGLASMSELSRAQLAQVTAEVGVITARFEYLLRRTMVDYHTAMLR